MQKIILAALLCFSVSRLYAQDNEPHDWNWRTDGRHIISFSPIGFMVVYGNFNPVAGLEYEYIVNREAGIALRLPMSFGYEGPEQSSLGSGDYKHTTFYAAPGVRFHAPIGHHSSEFCTGPAIVFGNQHFKPYQDYSGFSNLPYNYNLTGIIADNSINIYRRHFQFGFDARIGYLFEKQEDTRFFIHVGMHFGGKF